MCGSWAEHLHPRAKRRVPSLNTTDAISMHRLTLSVLRWTTSRERPTVERGLRDAATILWLDEARWFSHPWERLTLSRQAQSTMVLKSRQDCGAEHRRATLKPGLGQVSSQLLPRVTG